ncbi:MAG TPA: 2Fe-2S iron-sulfur cluster-binding protein, partial [Catalimonadaceae bacterium]|nr:2Fe-2S iron-sulfur cluster-binding protein [Catalimonadaceae bacterium]
MAKTTPDCTIISFDIPADLQSIFSFRHGQHLTLRKILKGEDVRRSYSLCSSPLDMEWKVAVKKIESGVFSQFVNEDLKIGDSIEVAHPNGSFFVEPDPAKEKQYVAFAAGSGITPIYSIIKTHLQTEPKSRFSLFYTNQNAGSIILKEEIEGLKNLYLDRFEVYFFLTQEERDISLFNGRMNAEKLNEISKYLLDIESVDHFFLCGPEELIFLIRDYLVGKGVDAKKLHFELFFTGASQKRVKANRTVLGTTSKMANITIKEGGKNFKFSMPMNGENILEAALGKNADLPFACKGGVCCTCKAKLLEGKVEMDVNYALEKEQLEAGDILTCQAVP